MNRELLNDLRLRFENVKKFIEMLETLGNDGKVISRSPKRQILTVLLQNYKTSAVNRFIEEPMLPDFVDLSTIFCLKL